MKLKLIICCALAGVFATSVAFAQNNPYVGEKTSAKHANVHRFHRSAHTSLHSAHHHKAMAAGKASIESHPRNKKPQAQ
jgi:outer membrane lipoprotein-sorting protein